MATEIPPELRVKFSVQKKKEPFIFRIQPPPFDFKVDDIKVNVDGGVPEKSVWVKFYKSDDEVVRSPIDSAIEVGGIVVPNGGSSSVEVSVENDFPEMRHGEIVIKISAP